MLAYFEALFSDNTSLGAQISNTLIIHLGQVPTGGSNSVLTRVKKLELTTPHRIMDPARIAVAAPPRPWPRTKLQTLQRNSSTVSACMALQEPLGHFYFSAALLAVPKTLHSVRS